MDKYSIHGRNILSMDLIYPWVPCNTGTIAQMPDSMMLFEVAFAISHRESPRPSSHTCSSESPKYPPRIQRVIGFVYRRHGLLKPEVLNHHDTSNPRKQ